MKTALITGANRGIGLTLTRHYAREGWHVVAACRDPMAGAGALAAEVAAGNVEIEQLDIADRQSIAALAGRVGSRAVDMLINNAGVFPRTQALESLPPASWTEAFAVNVTGPVELTLALLPALRAGAGRTVVSMSSALGSIAGTDGGSYAYRASKAALNMAMRSLAQDLAGEGFTIVLQSPGLVDTDMARDVPRAKISTEESVAGIARVIAALTVADNGNFHRHTGGTLPW